MAEGVLSGYTGVGRRSVSILWVVVSEGQETKSPSPWPCPYAHFSARAWPCAAPNVRSYTSLWQRPRRGEGTGNGPKVRANQTPSVRAKPAFGGMESGLRPSDFGLTITLGRWPCPYPHLWPFLRFYPEKRPRAGSTANQIGKEAAFQHQQPLFDHTEGRPTGSGITKRGFNRREWGYSTPLRGSVPLPRVTRDLAGARCPGYSM